MIGSVDIEIGELLDRCKNNQPEPIASEPASSSGPTMRRRGTTLTLYGTRGQEAGSLVVELRDPEASVDEPIIDSTGDDYERGLPTSPPIADPVQEPAEDSDGGILDYLRRAVEKTRIAADLLNETAEVRPGIRSAGCINWVHTRFFGQSRPYANIAWQLMESAFTVWFFLKSLA